MTPFGNKSFVFEGFSSESSRSGFIYRIRKLEDMMQRNSEQYARKINEFLTNTQRIVQRNAENRRCNLRTQIGADCTQFEQSYCGLSFKDNLPKFSTKREPPPGKAQQGFGAKDTIQGGTVLSLSLHRRFWGHDFPAGYRTSNLIIHDYSANYNYDQ